MLMTIAGLTTLMAQQTHDIKGVVTDKRNEPIVGALVTAEGYRHQFYNRYRR